MRVIIARKWLVVKDPARPANPVREKVEKNCGKMGREREEGANCLALEETNRDDVVMECASFGGRNREPAIALALLAGTGDK